MVMMMIMSYMLFAYFDLKATFRKEGKVKLIVYFVLMTVSCIIGSASGYVRDMFSPAEPIKHLVLGILGK